MEARVAWDEKWEEWYLTFPDGSTHSVPIEAGGKNPKRSRVMRRYLRDKYPGYAIRFEQ